MAKSKKADKSSTGQKVTDKERVAKGQILCRVIIEVLGAPKEYVEEAITLVVDKVKADESLELVSESTYEAEEKGKLFVTFSELEIWFKNMDSLVQFIFNFTPSSIEVMQPTSCVIPAIILSGFFNDFLMKMHELGLKVKDVSAKAQVLQKNTDALIRNFINVILVQPKSAGEISTLTGIPEDNIKAILAIYEKAGIVSLEGNKYLLKKEKGKK
jgi:hypothetical protein